MENIHTRLCQALVLIKKLSLVAWRPGNLPVVSTIVEVEHRLYFFGPGCLVYAARFFFQAYHYMVLSGDYTAGAAIRKTKKVQVCYNRLVLREIENGKVKEETRKSIG